MRTKRPPAAMALCSGGTAASAALVEVASNDTFATAQPIAVPVGTADVGVFNLGASGSDVDWLSIVVPVDSFLLVNTAPIEVPFTGPDTEVFGVRSTGTVLAQDDGEGEGLGSSITYLTTDAPETLDIAATGFLDAANGTTPHGEAGNYILTVPEPASAALLGLGSMLMPRRRR